MTAAVKYAPVAVPRGSYCSRSLTPIAPSDVAEFIANDHLCVDCCGEEDHVYNQRVIAAEQQSTVPDERSVA
jgi:hypothetical protein